MQQSQGPILSLEVNCRSRSELFPKESKQGRTLRLTKEENKLVLRRRGYPRRGTLEKCLPARGAWGDAGATFSRAEQRWALFI